MATKAQPDFTFDMSKYFTDMNKYVGDFKTPQVDIDALMSIQRRNMEAVAAANRLAVDAMQAVVARQTDIVRQAIEQVTGAGQDIAAAQTVTEKAAKQTELTKEQFERAVTNLRELSEMIIRSNSEAADVLNKRFVQSLDEMRDMLLKFKA